MDGHCIPGCETNDDCLSGTVCVDGSCLEGDCGNKYDCPIEYICDTAARKCEPGCEDDKDCYGYNECIGGECVERTGCEGTYQCGLAEMCTIEYNGTEDLPPQDRGCCYNPKTEGSETCPNPNEPQKFCDVCTDTQNQQGECGTNSYGKNYCVELQDKDGNSMGNFCLIHWDCSVAAGEDIEADPGTVECPRGYTCIKQEEGEMAGKYCLADCTREEFSQKK